jgi:hypothetical protein
LHNGELIAQAFVGGLRITELLGECKELRGLEGAEGALVVARFKNGGVEGLGELVDELGGIHLRVLMKRSSGTAGNSGVHGRAVDDPDAIIRCVASTIANVGVIADLVGIGFLIDQAVNVVGSFDFWGQWASPVGFLVLRTC